MPIHPYECQDCKKKYEVLYTSFEAKDREEPDEKCPHCQSKKKKRLPSWGSSFNLKGSGWYRKGFKG